MKNLLIADDNEQILDVLKEYAKKEGYDVYTAKTGKEALSEFPKGVHGPYYYDYRPGRGL